MLKEKKEKIVIDLADRMSRCTIAVATDYRGISAKEMVQLRRRLGELGIEYRVAKNTLTRFAAEKAGKKQLEGFLTGPLAIAFGYDDVTRPARALSEHIRSSGSVLRIKGGLLGDRLLSPGELSLLATVPSREILISQLMGQLRMPLQILHNVMNAPLRELLGVFQARIQQIEGGQDVTG